MTARHSAAVARYARRIAEAAGCPEAEQRLVHTAALYHDVGKVMFADRMFKAGKLTDEEWEIVKRHPERGAELVGHLPDHEDVAAIILAHHERIDGRGYPRGLAGEDIPRLSRMISIADTYDVMTGRDSYRQPVSSAEAIEELRRVSGSQLDGSLVEIFVEQVLAVEDLAFRHGDDADFEAELAGRARRPRRLAAGRASGGAPAARARSRLRALRIAHARLSLSRHAEPGPARPRPLARARVRRARCVLRGRRRRRRVAAVPHRQPRLPRHGGAPRGADRARRSRGSATSPSCTTSSSTATSSSSTASCACRTTAAFDETPLHWAYHFRDGRLQRQSTHASREAALEALSALRLLDDATFSLAEDAGSDGERVIRLRGELDIESAPDLERVLLRSRPARQRVVLDLGELKFMDSTGLRVLLRARAAAEEGRWEIVLRNVPPTIRRLFDMTGVHEALPAEKS